jgi:hypothetical protein
MNYRKINYIVDFLYSNNLKKEAAFLRKISYPIEEVFDFDSGEKITDYSEIAHYDDPETSDPSLPDVVNQRSNPISDYIEIAKNIKNSIYYFKVDLEDFLVKKYNSGQLSEDDQYIADLCHLKSPNRLSLERLVFDISSDAKLKDIMKRKVPNANLNEDVFLFQNSSPTYRDHDDSRSPFWLLHDLSHLIEFGDDQMYGEESVESALMLEIRSVPLKFETNDGCSLYDVMNYPFGSSISKEASDFIKKVFILELGYSEEDFLREKREMGSMARPEEYYHLMNWKLFSQIIKIGNLPMVADIENHLSSLYMYKGDNSIVIPERINMGGLQFNLIDSSGMTAAELGDSIKSELTKSLKNYSDRVLGIISGKLVINPT